MANQDDIDALYACPLSEFVDRRKRLATALRKAGNKALASTVASAAKPTPAAWAVNQLARRYPGEMAALMDAGAALRAELRACFAGQPNANAKAMASAQTDQREAVAALAPLARALLEAGGASASAAVIDRVTTTLTAISTTGSWGDCAPMRLAKELSPPGIEALAALVADIVPAPAPAKVAAAPKAPPAEEIPEKLAPETGALEKENTARQAAAEAAKQLAATEAAQQAAAAETALQAAAAAEQQAQAAAEAEAALQAAAAAEQQAQAALQSAQASLDQARERREQRQAHAFEAWNLAAALEKAAEDARKKAQIAAAAARKADADVEDSIRAERAARDELTTAQQAVTRAAAERAAAEAAVLRGRRPSV